MSVVTFGKAAGQIIAAVAPTIATALGGPVAGIAVSKLEGFFGVTGVPAVETALQAATSDQLAALRKIDDAFKEQMAQIGFDEDKLSYDDLASARAMQIATKDPNVARLAWTIVGGFLFISLVQLLALMLYPGAVKQIPEAGWLLIGNISGYLANEAKQAAAFYFGTTSASQAKDKTIADIAKS